MVTKNYLEDLPGVDLRGLKEAQNEVEKLNSVIVSSPHSDFIFAEDQGVITLILRRKGCENFRTPKFQI